MNERESYTRTYGSRRSKRESNRREGTERERIVTLITKTFIRVVSKKIFVTY